MTNAVVEYIGGIEVIKAFSQSKNSYAKYESAVTDNASFFYNWMKSGQWAMSAYNAITPSVLLTVLPFGVLFYACGNLTASTFVTVIILSLGLLEPMIAAMNYTDNIARVGTVMENIRKGKPGATDEKVINAAKAAGCDDFIRGLDKGYQTIVGSAGGHLSGRERQRIAIARAMLKDAPIVILDEATAYIDPENESIIQGAISKLVQGKTVIVIAHRLSTITDADNIIVINEGTVAAHGTHTDLLESSELYRSMWQAHTATKGGAQI